MIAEAKSRRRLAPELTTRRLLQNAAHGSESDPVGDEKHDRLYISHSELAKRTCAAARAFMKFPGFKALEIRPLPDRGDRAEFGLRLFRFAATNSTRKVAAVLARGDHPDTENDLWMILKQLYRYFDSLAGSAVPTRPAWKPRQNPILAPAEVPPQPVPVQLPPLTPALDAIWTALYRRAFTGKEFVKHFRDQGKRVSAESIRTRVRRLNRLKYKVQFSTLQGYFRPDAPPA